MATSHYFQVQHLKTASRWIYYTSTLFIMLTAFDLYYQDKASVNMEAKMHPQSSAISAPVYPWLLVVMNMASVIFICCHFTYCNKTVVLLSVATIAFLLVYRKLNAVNFDWLYNLPNFVAIISGLTWVFCDHALTQKENFQKDQNAESSIFNSTVTSSSPLDYAEKGASKSPITGAS